LKGVERFQQIACLQDKTIQLQKAAAAAVTPNTGGLDDGDDVPPGDVTQKALPADAPNAGADVAPKVSDEPEDDAKPRAAGAAASAEAAAAAVTPKTGPAPA